MTCRVSVSDMLVTYPFKRGERYRQNPCQKRQSTKKNILFHIEIFDLQHTVIMKIQFELDWSDLNDCSTKEVPYIYLSQCYQNIEVHFEFAQFRHFV